MNDFRSTLKSDIRYYNISEEPFRIYGVFFENGKYRRMPEEVAKSVSTGVLKLHDCTSGGRVLFKTDSPYIAIYAKMPTIGNMTHFALTGSAGFDLYERIDGKQEFVNTFKPPVTLKDGYETVSELGFGLYRKTGKSEYGYESVLDVGNGGIREYVINFPLYSEVESLYIGLSNKAKVQMPEEYQQGKPIVYYGSSITQGACASRPGNSYEAIISRKLNRDYINLGFSGNARGEDAIANYIKDLPMSFFVYDYDENSMTAEYLQKTHEKMFLTVRAKNPDLPVLLLSRPKYRLNKEEIKQLDVVKSTYQNAINRGDRHVYFVAGNEIFDETFEEIATVDHCHPNDCGFYRMSQKIGEVIKEVLG